MNVRYLFGVLLILGVAFLGVFIASPSTSMVQADEFVLLDGYRSILQDNQSNSATMVLYNVVLKELRDYQGNSVPPAWTVGVNGKYFATFNDAIYSYYTIESNAKIREALSFLSDSEGKHYELLIPYDKDGNILWDASQLAIIPKEYREGYYEVEVVNSADEVTGEMVETPLRLYRRSVCYETKSIPYSPSGRCNYYTVVNHSSLAEVDQSDVVGVKDVMSIFWETKKEKPFVSSTSGSDIVGIVGAPSDGDPLASAVPDVVVEETRDDVSDLPSLPQSIDTQVIPVSSPSDDALQHLAVKKKLKLYNYSGAGLLAGETTIFGENFEGSFPPGVWSVSDLTSTNGPDYWGKNAAKYSGSYGGWAAQYGSQISTYLNDSFLTGNLAGWTPITLVGDASSEGWSYSSTRNYDSGGSAYSAQWDIIFGNQYSDNMKRGLRYNTNYNASSWSNVKLNFRSWYNFSDTDKVYVMVSNDGGSNWTYFTTSACSVGGTSSNSWVFKSCSIPSGHYQSNFMVGFLIITNSSGFSEGAYVDAVSIEYERSNSLMGKYDDYMDAKMESPPIDVSSYLSTGIRWRTWIAAEPGYDYLEAYISSTGTSGSWSLLSQSSSTSGNWVLEDHGFNSGTGNIYVKYLFHSDLSNRDVGGRLDDIDVYGTSKLPNGSICSSGNECQSNICGGAHVDYRIHCNTDGSSTVYGDQRVYVNTCGGAGTYDHTNSDFTSGSCASQKVCDADLAYYNSTFTTSQICKTAIPFSCSTSPDCWNDNGGVDCKGNTAKICTYGNNGDYCTESAQCNSNICINNACSAGVPNGGVCTSDVMCQSKYCVADTSTQSYCQSPASYAPFTSIYDTWDAAASNNHSTSSDQVAFTSMSVRPVTYDLRESTDALCYDFDGDNVYDACYYDSNGCNGGQCLFDSCNYSIPNSVPSGKKFSCDVDSFFGCQIGVNTPDQICSGGTCSVSTSSIKAKDPKVTAFSDCDNSDGLLSQYTLTDSSFDDYWVVNPKYYYCNSQSSPGSQYTILGDYGPTYFDSIAIQGPLSCGSGTSCSILADEQYVNTPAGSIPSACKTNPNGACSQNSDCLYNKCQGNTCTNGFIYEGFLEDELTNPLANYTIKQYTCSNTLVQSFQTDSDGKFVFASGTGSYIMKLVVPWGEMAFGFAGGSCHDFGQGFIVGTTWVFDTHTTVHGQVVNPLGNPEVGQPWELSSCQDVTLTSTTTNTYGDFQLYTNSGKQKIKVDLNGTKFALEDNSGNTCFLNYGDVDLGQMEVTANCSLYNNTCPAEDSRLFNCSFDPQQGCVCSEQYCSNGCTEGAPQCNAVGTGTIHVVVKDDEKPVKNAPVKVNGASKGQTNGKGKLDINEEHGSYTVSASCPDNSNPTNQAIYLNSNHKYVTFNLDCGDPPKGDLLVRVENSDGYPVANVVINVDGEDQGLTDGFGQLYLNDLEFGSHPVRVIYKITNEVSPGVYQRVLLADINQSKVVLTAVALKPTEPGYTQAEIGPYTGNLFFIPAAVVIAAPIALQALDAVSIGWDAVELCKCALNQDTIDWKLLQCMGSFSNSTCSDIRTCENGFVQYAEQISEGKCWSESAFLAADIATPFIPLGLIGHAGAFFINHVPDLKLFDRIGNIGKVFRKSDNFIEYLAEDGFKYRAEIVDVASQKMKRAPLVGIEGLADLSDEGIQAAESLVQRYKNIYGASGEDAFKNLIGQSKDGFTITNDYMKVIYNGLGSMKNSTLASASFTKLENKLMKVVKEGDLGNIQGVLGEIHAGSSSKFINKISKYEEPTVGGRTIDFLLDNGDLMEAKNIDIVAIKNNPLKQDLYHTKIRQLAEQVYFANLVNPYKKVHTVFTQGTTSQIKTAISTDLKNALIDIDYTFALPSKWQLIVVEGLD